MLKKLMVTCFAAGLILAGSSLYAKDTGPGCGLGSQIFEGQKGLMANILASTTNGISGNQTFGMTSGTSGCDANTTVQNDTRQKVFLADNMDYLFLEMSQGKGEYLETYASLMGCHASVVPAFSKTMQIQHEKIFAGDYTAESVLSHTQETIQNSQQLSQNCFASR